MAKCRKPFVSASKAVWFVPRSPSFVSQYVRSTVHCNQFNSTFCHALLSSLCVSCLLTVLYDRQMFISRNNNLQTSRPVRLDSKLPRNLETEVESCSPIVFFSNPSRRTACIGGKSVAIGPRGSEK